MADNKRIAKNTMLLYFRMFLIMGVSLYTSRVILKTLGAEDFGIYNVVGGIVTMFSFLNGSLSGATSRYITFELGKKDYQRLSDVFNASFVIHSILALIIVLLCESIGLWFLYEKMVIPEERLNSAFWVFQISIATCVLNLTQVPYNANIIARENMKIYAYVGMIEVILKLCVVYLLVISPIDKLVFYALLLFLVQLSIVIFYRCYCISHYPECHLTGCKDKGLYKEMFSFAGSDLIGNISVMLQGQGINLLLNVFFGPVVNAARAIAYQIQGAVTQFGNNFMTAISPQIIKSYAEGDLKSMWRLVIQGSCFSYYLMWMICLPIMLESKTVLNLWLGDYPDHTTNFLFLILILCLIQTVKKPRVTIFHATGKVFWSNITVGIVLSLAFPLAYFFLKLGGNAESVFWAVNITMILSEFVSVAVLRKFVEFSIPKYFISVHLRCFLVTSLSCIVPCWLYDRILDPSFLRVIITVCISLLSVGITVFFIGFDKEIRDKILETLKTHLRK